MDRYLIFGALLLLTLEVGVLLDDLKIIHLTATSYQTKNQLPIGEVTSLHRDVRRRSQKSLIWEDTKSQESLYAYDSILTLKESRVQVKLENNVKLKIYENTLVVLEPEQKNESERIRVRFRRGNLSSQSPQPFTLGTGAWTIDAASGSELSIKSREQGQVELEIGSGSVEVINKNSQEKEQFDQGHRIKLGIDKVEEKTRIQESLLWKTKQNTRIYSHDFPKTFSLEWQGPAQNIEYYKPGEASKLINVSGYFKRELSLQPGTYFFVLKNSQGASTSLSVHLLNAPKIRYFSPLPRDRVASHTTTKFSWQNHPLASKYELELHTKDDTNSPVIKLPSSSHMLEKIIDREGRYFWSINLIDHEGYKIPAAFSYPLYFVNDPLPPPQWIKPTRKLLPLRKPATDKQKIRKTSDDSAFYFWHPFNIWPLMFRTIPNALAQTLHQEIKTVFIQWQKIPEADFYVLEVAKDAGFQNLILNQRVYNNEYYWREDFQQEIYFIRVAGGTKNGRMGLFSSPQSININELAVDVPVPAQSIVQQTQSSSSPSPEEYHITPPERQELKKIDTVDSNISLQNIEKEMRFWMAGSYRYEQQKVNEDFESEFNGFNSLKLGGQLIYHNWMHSFQYSYTNWKADEKFNFQENLKSSDYQAQTMYSLKNNWYAGVSLFSENLLQRKGFEEVDIELKWLAGASIFYSQDIDLTRWSWQASLIGNDYHMGLHSNLEWTYKIKNFHQVYFFGAQLDIMALSGSQYDLYRGELGLIFGFEW